MKKFCFILFVFCVHDAIAALATTYCNAEAVYTSCNAGYYLSGGDCVACAVGTYKSTAGTGTTCSQCAASDGVSGTTATTATTAQTSCYIPSGVSLTDDVGSYEFTSNCYYSE